MSAKKSPSRQNSAKGASAKKATSPDDLTKAGKKTDIELSEDELKDVAGGNNPATKDFLEALDCAPDRYKAHCDERRIERGRFEAFAANGAN